MKPRIAISRLMIVVAIAAVDLALTRWLAEGWSGYWDRPKIFAFLVIYESAALCVIVTFGKFMRRAPGDRLSGSTGCFLLGAILLFSCLLVPLLLLLFATMRVR